MRFRFFYTLAVVLLVGACANPASSSSTGGGGTSTDYTGGLAGTYTNSGYTNLALSSGTWSGAPGKVLAYKVSETTLSLIYYKNSTDTTQFSSVTPTGVTLVYQAAYPANTTYLEFFGSDSQCWVLKLNGSGSGAILNIGFGSSYTVAYNSGSPALTYTKQ